MPFESAGKSSASIEENVKLIQSSYSGFTSGLRGLTAEIMTGLGIGLFSLASVHRTFDRYRANQQDAILGRMDAALRGASISSLAASEAFTGKLVSDNALLASDALVDGFANDLTDKLVAQMLQDIRTAEMFIRKQMIQGRTVSTTEQLAVELEFVKQDSKGRNIQSSDFVSREVNWALRTVYNTSLIYAAVELGVEQFQVTGGSHDGEVLDIEEYEKKAGAYFHHNSKSLLQPY